MILACSEYYDSHFKSSHLICFTVLWDGTHFYTCAVDEETETEQVDFKQFVINHDVAEISRSEYTW